MGGMSRPAESSDMMNTLRAAGKQKSGMPFLRRDPHSIIPPAAGASLPLFGGRTLIYRLISRFAGIILSLVGVSMGLWRP